MCVSARALISSDGNMKPGGTSLKSSYRTHRCVMGTGFFTVQL